MVGLSGGWTGRRIRLAHHLLELDDGHRVGISVGGRGVPLVFMHGLALSRRAYLRMLSRVAGLGFLVIAIDAAGHGQTHNLPRGAGEFADRVNLTLTTLDVLGVERAVIAGHSMGGRMAIQLAATAPERVLAAVLFDAAAGRSFDETVRALPRSPRNAVRTLAGLAYDMQRDPFRLSLAEARRYVLMLASVAAANARQPAGIVAAAHAVIRSGDYAPLLNIMRDNGIPTFALHGEHDLIVPVDSARELAEDADATLYVLPGATHSWMIANPRHGADALRQLLEGELGTVLADAATVLGVANWRDSSAWDNRMIGRQARIRELIGAVEDLGAEPREHVRLELVRRAVNSRQTVDTAGALRRR